MDLREIPTLPDQIPGEGLMLLYSQALARNQKMSQLVQNPEAPGKEGRSTEKPGASVKGRSAMLLQRDLLDRGWTKPMIVRFLIGPDRIKKWSGDGHYCLFDRARVLRAEGKKRWQLARDKIAACRDDRRVQALQRQIVKDYLAEVMGLDETGKPIWPDWSGHPAVQEYWFERNRSKERESLAQVGVLPAIFAMNREAKRQRDAARNNFANGEFDAASSSAKRKLHLYDLKGQAMEWALRDGLLERVGWHRFGDNFAEVLAGGGYRFHRPAPRPEHADVVQNLAEIEAKPVEEAEVPIGLAEMAIKGYLQGRERVNIYEWPARRNPEMDLEDAEEDACW